MSVNTNDKVKNNLLDKTIDIEPVGVIYNLTSEMVENYVENYLYKSGVDGVSRVKLLVRNEGRTNPYISLYLFIDRNSKAIVSSVQSVPDILKDKIDKVRMNLSDDFKKIIRPLVGQDIESGRAEGRDVYVKLNIFRTVGMMLSVTPGKHNLTISDAKRLPKGNAVFSVVKTSNYSYGSSDDGDKYSRQVNDLERRHR